VQYTNSLCLPFVQIWVTELAPEPRDVQWSNLSIPRYSKSVRHLLISVAVFFLVSCAATRQSTSHLHEEIDRLKNPSIDGLSAFSCSGQVDDQCSSGRVVSVYIVDYSIVGTLLVGRSDQIAKLQKTGAGSPAP
jgi:hypothetical protein